MPYAKASSCSEYVASNAVPSRISATPTERIKSTSPDVGRKSTPRSPAGSSRLASNRESGHVVKNGILRGSNAGRTRRPRPHIRRARSRAPRRAFAPFLRTPLGRAATNAPRHTPCRSGSVGTGTPAPRTSTSLTEVRGTGRAALRWAQRKSRCCTPCRRNRPLGASAAGSRAPRLHPTALSSRRCNSFRRALGRPPSGLRAQCPRSTVTGQKRSVP